MANDGSNNAVIEKAVLKTLFRGLPADGQDARPQSGNRHSNMALAQQMGGSANDLSVTVAAGLSVIGQAKPMSTTFVVFAAADLG